MSVAANGSVRCDECGRLSRNLLGEYVRPDGSAGYINDPANETGRDLCDECKVRVAARDPHQED